MHKQIIWAPLAENDFASILDYMDKNRDSKVALNFIDPKENVIGQISIDPKQYPVIFKKKIIRKCFLTKHNSRFYRDSRVQIEISRKYDTRQDPESLVL